VRGEADVRRGERKKKGSRKGADEDPVDDGASGADMTGMSI